VTTIHRSALVPYSARAMFDLVADIPSYPDFLPWCGGARYLSRDEDVSVAAIDIAYSGVHKSFTTRNLMQPGRLLEMHLVNGPFRHLHGHWRFEALDEHASKILLDMDFEFSNRLLALAINPVFTRIANTLVDSFVERARNLYGSPKDRV
jgi:ribosome-associated toxin RatA of RatAB toxin-antitoxin module